MAGLWIFTQEGDLVFCNNFRVEKDRGWICIVAYLLTRSTAFSRVTLGKYSNTDNASYVMKNIMTRINNENRKVFLMPGDTSMGIEGQHHVD